MVQLLVCAVDKVNASDAFANCQCPKRGDVIDAFDDTFDLSKYPACAQNPNWLIIHVPGTVADVAALMAAEKDPNPAAKLDPRLASKTLQYRANKINIAALGLNETAIQTAKQNAPTKTGIDAAVPLLAITAATVAKLPITDPTLIGNAVPAVDPIVIG